MHWIDPSPDLYPLKILKLNSLEYFRQKNLSETMYSVASIYNLLISYNFILCENLIIYIVLSPRSEISNHAVQTVLKVIPEYGSR